MKLVYKTKNGWKEGSDHALVTICSDPRFIPGTMEFLTEELGLTRFDPIIVPGGPSQLLPKDSPLRSQVTLLNDLHAFKRIVAVLHGNVCGYYKHIRGIPHENQRDHQKADLEAFKQVAKELVPNAKVECYLAEADNEKVGFHKI